MKRPRPWMICFLALLLGACTGSSSLCRGPLRPINVAPTLIQESAP